jgi:hypothetical protein
MIASAQVAIYLSGLHEILPDCAMAMVPAWFQLTRIQASQHESSHLTNLRNLARLRRSPTGLKCEKRRQRSSRKLLKASSAFVSENSPARWSAAGRILCVITAP